MTFIEHSWYLTVRNVRFLMRQPAYLMITLIQPIFWLLLFGALFKNVVLIPGFASKSYIDFLTPGIVVMTASFSSAWMGMGFIEAMDRGVMSRFLTSPASRGALIAGSLAYGAIISLVQAVIIMALALLSGAHFASVGGALLLVLMAVLLGAALGSFSNAIALLTRKQETLIGASNLLVLPLTFLSSAFMQQNLAGSWIQTVAPFNPVNWAVTAGREAISAAPDWTAVATQGGYLAALALVCAWLSTRAFRAYQRSI